MLQKVNRRNGLGNHGRVGHNSHRALYRSYVFKDKDPIIDRVRTLVEDEGIEERKLAIISGVSASTLSNWFDGETKKPQFATIAAVTTAMGYVTDFVKEKKPNYVKEFERATEEIAAAKKREQRRLARTS